jgi:hypothetical protein
MYFIAITNWRKKLVYFFAFLIIIASVFFIVPQMLGLNTTSTNSEPQEEEILSQPIKVHSVPDGANSLEIELKK